MDSENNQVLIVGGGQGGVAMLEMLLSEKLVSVAGVVDQRSDAPGVHLAGSYDIPTYADLDQAMDTCGSCLIFDLTDNPDVARHIRRRNHVGGVIGGSEALLMWRMVTRMHEMKCELEHQATRDALTSVYNRRFMTEEIQRSLAEAARYGLDYSAAMIDIDHFKAINDVYGHPSGDEVIKAVASFLQSQIRESDTLGRWGGEEFLVLMPHVGGRQAAMAAERWLASFVARPVALGNGHAKTVTFSAGIASLDSASLKDGGEHAANTFLEQLDKQLYRAKHDGRNRVASAD